MFGIKYIIEPYKIVYFHSIESNWVLFCSDIRGAESFVTREECLSFIELLKKEFDVCFENAEVFKFELPEVK